MCPSATNANASFNYAAEEAEKLSHMFIGTGHLFLGVLREQDCFAAKLLRERGISLEKAREQIGSTRPEQLGRTPGFTRNPPAGL
jgi:ATP-dependent Clp protease ATP-binding subunit ClpC